MDRFVNERNLKATAIYYTDLEAFARAESSIRDGMRYAPKTPLTAAKDIVSH